LLAITLLLTVSARASAGKPDSTKIKRTDAVRMLAEHLDGVYLLSIHLSNHFVGLRYDKSSTLQIRNHVRDDIKNVDSLVKHFFNDTLKTSGVFTVRERSAISEQSENFHLKDSVMKESINGLLKEGGSAPQVHIDYVVGAINSFITTTVDFKQYIQSLVPVVPDTLYDKINTIINAVEHTTNGNQYIIASGFNHNVFGLSYFHRIGGISKAKIISYLGVEVIGPVGSSTVRTSESQGTLDLQKPGTITFTSLQVSSSYAKNPGGYIIYGLRDSKLLLQVGVGYFETSAGNENVSWKCGLLYTPQNLGIGFTYSPLTSVGVQVAYKW
jgi:hypothetical protein